MTDILRHNILKYTGKSGYERVVNSVSFKSVDTATYFDDSDSLNYPVYEPYLTEYSLSYENWTKLSLEILPDLIDNINSRGLTIKIDDCGFCYNKTYTKIKNIALCFDALPLDAVIIRFGLTNMYNRPVNSRSSIAVETIETYYNDTLEFNNQLKVPLYFNGKNELLISEINGAKTDEFIVWQLEILKGIKYQIDPRVLKFKLHYELV